MRLFQNKGYVTKPNLYVKSKLCFAKKMINTQDTVAFARLSGFSCVPQNDKKTRAFLEHNGHNCPMRHKQSDNYAQNEK